MWPRLPFALKGSPGQAHESLVGVCSSDLHFPAHTQAPGFPVLLSEPSPAYRCLLFVSRAWTELRERRVCRVTEAPVACL